MAGAPQVMSDDTEVSVSRAYRKIRCLALGVATALTTALLTAPTMAAQPTGTAGGEAQRASSAAKAGGSRVELAGARDATTEVFANPDGTFTTEVYAAPVRVRGLDGTWSPIDLTLRHTGGGVTPMRSPVKLRLSGGGEGPLVTLSRYGKSYSLSWPGPLPAPVLDGDTATYPEVLSGVDLKVQAFDVGFSQALVVKSPEAARNPALAKVRFRVGLDGVSVRQSAGGSISAVDESGREVFGSGTPTMWDSGGAPDGLVDALEDGGGNRVAGAAVGARRAAMPSRLVDSTLELTTDAGMLSDPKTVFPVYIDPSSAVDLNYWTMINSHFPSQSYWSYDRAEGAKVGYVYDGYQGRYHRYRSLFRFATSAFKGKHVLKTEFSATLYHSYSCTKSRADVYHVTSGFSSSTDWDNSTPWSNYLANAYGQSCSSSGDLRMEWGSEAMRAAADATTSDWFVLGLRANDESTVNAGWKKFKTSTAKLVVTHNTAPAAPSKLTVDGHGCVQGANRPVVNSLSPRLSASLYDADGNAMDVRVYWAPVGGTVSDANSKVDTNNGSGPLSLPEGWITAGALTDGRSYFVQMYAYDGSDRGALSAKCEFTIDTSWPDSLPSISPTVGEEALGAGHTRTFVLDPNKVTDIVAYEYGLSDPPTLPATAAADGTAVIKLTPTSRGANYLYVRSKDRAGNYSDIRKDYWFDVASPAGPAAHYQMSEADPAAQVLVDSSGNGKDATLNGPVVRTTGRVGTGRDKAIGLDGTGGHASLPSPVVNTAKTFTVAAWARLTSTGDDRTMVSVDGSWGSGFHLRYNKIDNKWAFVMPDVDGAGTQFQALSNEVPRLNMWTHLVGTYDEATGRMTLYVNGIAQTIQSTNMTPWEAGGPTRIGQAQSAGAPASLFAGDIDEVRLWNRLLADTEVQAIVDEVTLVGQWLFEDVPAGTAESVDTSGYGHTATLLGPIVKGVGRDGTTGVTGNGGWAPTQTPVLLTDQSMTISAWVRLTDTSNWRTAVSQVGAHCSAFLLQYDYQSKKWAFSSSSGDVNGATPTRAKSTVAPLVGEWVHLTGVYDASDKQLRIYVNGVPQQEGTVSFTPWNATGPLHIGVSLWDTNRGDAWRGDIDEVRVFAGVLSDEQIRELPEL